MMKRNLFFLAVLIPVFSLQLSAQTSNEFVKDALANPNIKITWLGADFSHCKIQDYLDCDPDRFAMMFVPAINNLTIAEPAKFDFAKYLKKSSFTSDLSAVTKSNETIQPDQMTQDTQKKLDDATINSIVSGYDLKDKEGIGAVIIYESLSKKNLYASMYFTYVKMPEGKVILSKHVAEKPIGFGLRNFWAATIFGFLKDYEKIYQKTWKAEYGIK